ncbi:MAG: hypothetical protein E7096_06525 [Bacteroides sp.]|nr:hypothetical protein [Bacteroides sp.]
MKRRLEIRNVVWLLMVTLFLSCQKEEIDAPLVQAGEAIRFQTEQIQDSNPSRAASSNVGTYRNTMVMRSGTSVDTLAVNVYSQDGISNTPRSRGAVLDGNNLTSFAVYASRTRNNTATSFIKDWRIARDASTGNCTSDAAYYWPGNVYTLQFMALAPYHPQGLTVNQDASSAMPVSFTYELPDAAVNQADLMLATTQEYAGDYYLNVPLTFKHLCSAVNVKVGTIPQGSIQSITFKNIYNKGTYTLASDAWSVNGNSKADFVVDFVGTSTNYPTTGAETGNPLINDANATFMMIPQTLPVDAEMIVSFTHTLSGKTENLSCSLAGIEWAKATTTNYLINISPYYELYIEEEEVPIADCHYDMRVIHIKNDYTNKEWTLSSNQDWAKFRLMPADYETNADYQAYNDYWFENHKVITQNISYNSSGSQTENTTQTVDYGLSNSISSSGNQVVLVYLKENTGTGTGTRAATLSLKTGDKEVSSVEMKQYYPLWNNNLAFERIEEDENGYRWGFASTRTVTYTYPAIDDVDWGDYQRYWEWIKENRTSLLWGWLCRILYNNVIGDKEAARSEAYTTFYNTYYNTPTNQSTGFVTMAGSADDGWSVKLDYGKLNNISTGADGLSNTLAILSYGGNATTSDAETWLINNGLKKGTETSSADETTIPETAAYHAIMRNKCNLTTKITNTTRIVNGQSFTETTSVNELSLTEDGIQWFLPSSGEISSLIQTACDSDPNNNDESLSGSYWTSTSSTNPNAYSFNASGSVSTTNRTSALKVRSARKKP